MKNIVHLSVLLLLLVYSPSALALTFTFDTSNVFGEWAGESAAGYGTVDIEKNAEGFIVFTVRANDSFFIPAADGPGLTWDKFYFNFNEEKSLELSTIEIVSSGRWTFKATNNSVSMFGDFDYGGTGNKIKNESVNPLEFVIKDASLDPEDFVYAKDQDWYFAGHLRRFESIDGTDSNYVGVGGVPNVVPEPASILLIGAGLAGLAGAQRFRRK